uniref:Beta-casein n=1 Tax=Loxodonta africana TaxID=9785 RepID=G3U197_LOXAF
MKVFILACLVAFALGREKEEIIVSTETVENLSSSEIRQFYSEESVTQVNKQKPEGVKHEEQQREDEHQNKIQPLFQPQPLVYPFAEPIPYTVFPPNAIPLAQPIVVLPFPQPEVKQLPEAKEITFPRQKLMSFLKSPVMPFFDPQIPNLGTDLENLHLPLPLLQPLRHQLHQPLAQTPVLPLPLSLPKVLPVPQQVIPYPQRGRPIQNLQLYEEPLLDPTRKIYPVAQPLAPVYNPVAV